MKPRDLAILAAAFAVSFLAVGLPYWQVPYADVSLPGTLLGAQLVAVIAAAAAATFARAGALPVLAVVGASAPVAVLVRVLHDASLDPTSHNLWPFEIVLAGVIGLAAAFAGLVLGLLLSKAIGLQDEGA